MPEPVTRESTWDEADLAWDAAGFTWDPPPQTYAGVKVAPSETNRPAGLGAPGGR